MSDRRVTALIKMERDQPKTWGGKREGAGRKKSGKKLGGPHRKRPRFATRRAFHVVLRVMKGVPRLRTGEMYAAIRRALGRCIGNADFGGGHASVQRNPL